MTSARPAPTPSEKNPDTWVIVRCYNEAPVVGDVVRALRNHFENVVGVDDGSTDTSFDEMQRNGALVVRHVINLGPGAALQTGLQFSLLDHSARMFVCFDADGQHRVEDALAMVQRMRAERLDVIVGSRFLGSTTGMPRGRGLLLRIARSVERLNSGARLTDAHNGLRVLSRRFAERVDLSMHDMAYASELTRLIHHSGLPYAEHPVTIDYTEYSKSKGQRSINSVNIALDVWISQMFRGRRR